MKRFLALLVVLFVLVFTYTTIAQELGLLRKVYKISFPEKIQKLVLDPLPAGTYTIGTGGYFPTIDSAFNKLSVDGVAGPVTLELINTLYIAPTDSFGFMLTGPIPGAGANSRITIKPATNKIVTIEGSGPAVVKFINTSYVTLDGVGLTGATTLTIHSLRNTTYLWNDVMDVIENSDHNVIQNIIFINEDVIYGSFTIWAGQGSTNAPDSNLIQNNFVKKGGTPFWVSTYESPFRATGNIIRGNKIGSEVDSLLGWGIQLERCQNTIVENNIVQNCKVTPTIGEILQIGINSYAGLGDIIRNNIVHNIKASSGYSSVGILLSGGSGGYGVNNKVYNNMVYDIQSTSTQADSRVAGIQMWYQTEPKIYFNTVYLSGTGANHQGSAALYIYQWGGNCTGIDLRNNIFINNRNEYPYFASSIYDYSSSNLTSDYNDLNCAPNQYNCAVRINYTNYITLADWQATGKDINSISEMPNFVAPDNLHMNIIIPTYIESGGTPIVGFTSDFDGELRNPTTPDIGADEFEGMRLPVELTSFTAVVNGKEVMLSWSTATELNNHGFEIQRSGEGAEFLTVGFVKGHGTTTEQQNYNYADKNLNNGKYCYRLKQVDYDGSYEYSDIAEVEWRAFNSYLLEQNYPNPFNPSTTIGFGIQNKSNVKIRVLNTIGEEVAVLLNEERQPGYFQVEFNAAGMPSGVYFCQLQAGSFVQTKKMTLMK